MARRSTTQPPSLSFAIAIEGEGVDPRDVPIRQLAQLLESVSATIEALAAERGVDPPTVSLSKVTNGSARYGMLIVAPSGPQVMRSFVSAVKKRGRGSSPKVRTSLERLHKAAAKTGALRIEPPAAPSGPVKPIYLAAPVEDSNDLVDEGTVIAGRVVGLNIDAYDRATIRIRFEDSGHGDFGASPEILTQASPLIGKRVAARVTYQRGEERDFEGEIEGIEERPVSTDDFLAAMERVADQLRAAGVEIHASDWLAGDD